MEINEAFERELPYRLELLVRVRGKGIHSDDGLQSVAVHDPDVSREVLSADFDRVEAPVRIARVMLQRPDRRYEHHRIRSQPAY